MPEHASTYAVTVAFVLRAESRDDFLALVKANAAASLREETGCLRFDVLAPLSAAETDVLLYEVYESSAAFADHLRSRHFLEFDRATRDMVVRKAVSEYAVANAA